MPVKRYNGSGWDVVAGDGTGPSGPIGPSGPSGPSGPTGAAGIVLYDSDQNVLVQQVYG